MPDVIARTPGEGRYARLEREQRWLAGGVPDGAADPVLIADCYLTGTRLRLRRMEGGGEVVFKLGQKIRPNAADPGAVRLTNMYLSAPEYDILNALPGAGLSKTRWRWPVDGRQLAVDHFHGPLEGLVLLEAELEVDEPRRSAPLPGLVEVTDDDRYSGGRLAHATPEEIRSLLGRSSPPG